MAYRCPHYRCETTTMEGLVQQVALSYLRHGYWWYVTGIIPARKEPCEVDRNILTKYDIRKDWRVAADNKRRGLANLAYEFAHTGFAPYQAVKRQLVRIIKDINQARRLAGCDEQLPYRIVLGLKRQQLSPFETAEPANFNSDYSSHGGPEPANAAGAEAVVASGGHQ